MKTESAEADPTQTVTLVLHFAEAREIEFALEQYERNYHGHPDCRPRTGNLIRSIRKAIEEAHPNFYEKCLGKEIREQLFKENPVALDFMDELETIKRRLTALEHRSRNPKLKLHPWTQPIKFQ